MESEIQWPALTIRRLHIQNEIKRIIIVGNLGTEATEIELIMNVLIIHLTEELIASQATEPGNPRSVLSIRSTHIWLLTVCVRVLCRTTVKQWKKWFATFQVADIVRQWSWTHGHQQILLREFT
jgi:hypothetical protein